MIGESLDIPAVDVLLATYNGAPYIEEMIRSIGKQRGVAVHLVVSDDGSTDNTIPILRRLQTDLVEDFLSFVVLTGPSLGPKENFFFLLQHAKSNYVALADQDDIWLSNHLLNSIIRIREIESLKDSSQLPLLTFCSVLEMSKGRNRKTFPSSYRSPSMFSNPSRGCTQVMNKRLADIVCKFELPNNKIIMHDWWILLLAESFGKVTFCSTPEVIYRLHSSNFTRNSRRLNFKLLSSFRILLGHRDWGPLAQVLALPADSYIRQSVIELIRISNSFTFLTRFIYFIVDSQKGRNKTFYRLVQGFLFFASLRRIRTRGAL